MNTYIRRSNKTDISFLEHLESLCFPSYQQSSKRSLQLSLSSQNQETWILETDDKTSDRKKIGANIYHIHSKCLRIFSLAISPNFQQNGYGTELVRHAIKRAQELQHEYISLEVESQNKLLVNWYTKQGFIISHTLPNYYKNSIHAYKMTLPLEKQEKSNRTINLIVVNDPKKWNLNIENVDIISAREYTSKPEVWYHTKKIRVFNLCNSYRYQSLGYYVSLLASARDHRVIPDATTIRDFQDIKIIRSITHDIDQTIQQTLQKTPHNHLCFNVYFGKTIDPQFNVLAHKIYQIFEAPLFQINFSKTDKWLIKKITPLSLQKIKDEDIEIVKKFAQTYFNTKYFRKKKTKNYLYDLAILINPEEKNPPSCKHALRIFKKTAENMGFYTEFITKNDYNRLSEFDALFIRETTSVNNHTYQISRKAYAEGLVVIDDPWSILRCSNKIYLEERLKLNKINTPKSVFLYKQDFAHKNIPKIPFPIVLKLPDSAFSKGVIKVGNQEELNSIIQELFKKSDLIIGQEFIPSTYDWRIGILDQQVLFACKYYMAKGHWQIYNWQGKKNDVSGKSVTVPIEEVPDTIIETALKATSLIGDGLYGVDLKQIDEAVYIIEINDNPNIDNGIEDEILGIKLYKKIINSFLTRIEISRNISRFISV